MAETLPQFLARQLARHHLSKKELAHRLGISPGYLTRLMRSQRVLAVDSERVLAWATTLKLTRAEMVELVELVELANASPFMRALVAKLRAELRAANRRSRSP